MTPLIRKEIRLLLPFFGIALVLAAVPAWFFPEQSYMAPLNEGVFWAELSGAQSRLPLLHEVEERAAERRCSGFRG